MCDVGCEISDRAFDEFKDFYDFYDFNDFNGFNDLNPPASPERAGSRWRAGDLNDQLNCESPDDEAKQ